MTDKVQRTPDTRPQFNPSRLVMLVMETLGARFGVGCTVDSVTVGTAVNAAADLLRALGVAPTTAPRLPAPTRPGNKGR